MGPVGVQEVDPLEGGDLDLGESRQGPWRYATAPLVVWITATATLAFTAAAVAPEGWRKLLTFALVALAGVLGPVAYSRRSSSRRQYVAGIAVTVALLVAGGVVSSWPVVAENSDDEVFSSPSPSLDPDQPSVPGAPPGSVGPTSCLEVGVGEPGYEFAFRAAYERHGGARRLGCATNRVTRVEGGVHQNFMGPDGQSAIFATEPDRALVLNAKYHEAYRLIGGGDGMVSVGRAGYPLDEGTEVAGGSLLTVGAGGFEISGVARRNGGKWIWVPSRIWKGLHRTI